MRKYIHYGNDHFDPMKFKSIRNCDYDSKPMCGTGFWAAPAEDTSGYDWYTHVKGDEILCDEKDLTISFTLTVPDNANIVVLRDNMDILALSDYICRYDSLLETRIQNPSAFPPTISLDFEKMCECGIDGVELDLQDHYDYMHYFFYGWDVNSILIMNKNIIHPE